MTQFSTLDLSPLLHKALNKVGHHTPTPIQEQAIPTLLEGRDLLGIAQTGTGKTAAFALPILDHLSKNRRLPRPTHTRVLVLTPTRELASQIVESFSLYGQFTRFSKTVVFGGVSQIPQVRAMSRGVDVLVATPGRLLDLMGQRKIHLDQVEIFVLDEADRMLDMGFIQDIQRIITYLPAKRQTLLFSATMPSDIAKLAEDLLQNPVRVEVTPSASTVERVEQKVLFVEKPNKHNLLNHLLAQEGMERVLIFTRTKHGANRVAEHLESSDIRATAIHGNKSQSAREDALRSFRIGQVRVLVATDIASRGIDVVGISHVINFDMPNEPESYVHRIGRTARAGREGVAISFCDTTERSFLREIERTIRRPVPIDVDHPYHVVTPPASTRDVRQAHRFPMDKKRSRGAAGLAGRGGELQNVTLPARADAQAKTIPQPAEVATRPAPARIPRKTIAPGVPTPGRGSSGRSPRSTAGRARVIGS